MRKPIEHEFSIPFDRTAEALWKVVSDTQRINELVGNPKYEAYEVTRDDGAVDVFGRLRIVGLAIEWLEVPVNWIENRWFEQIRRFSHGPVVELAARFQIVEDDAGSRCDCRLTSVPRYPLVGLALRRATTKFERGLRTVVAKASRDLSLRQPVRYESAVRISPSVRARADQLVGRIEATPYGHGLAHRLAEHVLTAQEIDLWTLRPLALARDWGADAREVIELCLQAVREGLLESRWDLLCPRCRVAKDQFVKMEDLPDGVHCPACNIDYQADFARNVELAFSPGPAIRPVEYGFFCRSGPMVTPHIKGQITLEPAEHRPVTAGLLPGDYRIRTLEAGGEVEVAWDGGGFPSVRVADDKVYTGIPSPPGLLEFTNQGSNRRTVIIEDRSWRRDVLTAERVTTVQAFRDLFSDQVLRAGDDVVISNVTFMFTDLTGSTSMFAQIGDALAYQIVREHFALLGGVIREHDGTIVKTIGDGIHAAFNAPDDALRAALSIQAAMVEASRDDARLDVSIRIGLHTGSSISVTLNERLDYYGNTVNMAARLEGQGRGGEITMSEAFVNDVAVKSLLSPFEVRESTVRLKGFDDPVPIYQLVP